MASEHGEAGQSLGGKARRSFRAQKKPEQSEQQGDISRFMGVDKLSLHENCKTDWAKRLGNMWELVLCGEKDRGAGKNECVMSNGVAQTSG